MPDLRLIIENGRTTDVVLARTKFFGPCSHDTSVERAALRGTHVAPPRETTTRQPQSIEHSRARSCFVNQHSDRHAPGIAKSAICVQRFDDSLNSAIHTTYRSWLRSSSMHEPRDPPLKVMLSYCNFSETKLNVKKIRNSRGRAMAK